MVTRRHHDDHLWRGEYGRRTAIGLAGRSPRMAVRLLDPGEQYFTQFNPSRTNLTTLAPRHPVLLRGRDDLPARSADRPNAQDPPFRPRGSRLDRIILSPWLSDDLDPWILVSHLVHQALVVTAGLGQSPRFGRRPSDICLCGEKG